MAEQKLYQHIQIFGHAGAYTVRVDNDASTEKTFRSYDGALMWAIKYLIQSGLDGHDEM